METLYFLSAVVGGTILVLQVLLTLFGLGDAEVDVDGDVDFATHADATDAFFKVLSFKTLVAFVTFFGLSGLACGHAGLSTLWTFVVSFAAGSAALYVVAWMMAGLARLQSAGNFDLRRAIGSAAKVYLTVPGQNAGQGKVTVALQGRSVEAKAVTGGESLSSGAMVRIIGVAAPDTVEVVPLEED